MMRSVLLVLLVALAVASVEAAKGSKRHSGKDLVEHVNKQGKWTAKVYPQFEGKTRDELRRYLPLRSSKFSREPRAPRPARNSIKREDAPLNFDSVDAWPKCAGIIGAIENPGECGADYAIVTTSVMSDRLCIASNGTIQKPLSALDVMACCSECGYECDGGWIEEVFLYWLRTGVVTGANYTTDTGCKPWPISPQTAGRAARRPTSQFAEYSCVKQCQPAYKDETYANDLYYGKGIEYLADEPDDMITELITNGPVVTMMDVYEDFWQYGGGVYEHVSGDYAGEIAVRIVGYGQTDDGKLYWKIANFWGADWGENGYFRILRNTNECNIETEVSSALPDIPRSLRNK